MDEQTLRHRVALVGAGNHGAGHARYYAASPRTELVALVDPAVGPRDALAAELGTRGVDQLSQVLDDVDAVIIASPNRFHLEQAIQSAEAGKAVFCEKPMGLDLAEADQIVAAVDAAGVASTVGFAVRFDGVMQAMARRVHEGEVGRLFALTSRRLFTMPAFSEGWRANIAETGGVLYEINLHEVDWMMALGGEVESVYAKTFALNPSSPRANDHIWITFNFAGGAGGFHEGSWIASNAAFYRMVQGTEGGLATDEWGSKLMSTRPGGDRIDLPSDPAFDLRGHFLDCIEGIATPVADVHWARKVMAVCEAVMQSAREGVPVRPDSLRSRSPAGPRIG